MQEIFVGRSSLVQEDLAVEGKYVVIDKEDFYCIGNYDGMKPFFMSMVSASDHWLFISSTGGLTAGRKNESSSLFPYYTDDKISDSIETTGSKSIFRIKKDGQLYLWEPFSNRYAGLYKVIRNVYKNTVGNKLIFEEHNEDLDIVYRYLWTFSDKYGFVRKSTLTNIGDKSLEVELLDGIQNILPYGVNSGLQNERSNLVNAYKKNELLSETGLGLFLLSSIIVDKAEPSEALKSTTVWSSGVDPDLYLLSSQQLDQFRRGGSLHKEEDIRAEAGSYLLHASVVLDPNGEENWIIVAEVNQDLTSVTDLSNELKNKRRDLVKDLELDIEKGTRSLRRLVGMADGLQVTGDKLSCARHYSNVLFNIMRGGIFEEGYEIESYDFVDYVTRANSTVLEGNRDYLESLPERVGYTELLKDVKNREDSDLIRLCYEYLPLTFSRRHGDPSRPWNKFSIETRKEDGSKNLDYQGNWRDIFQNWEALSLSYPGYINSFITKFVNASTIDGYNPYRIMRNGIDWEVIEPDDPWSYIGYWGDHQIIYLLKLLEISHSHDADSLKDLLDKPWFVYANVPYRIRSYNDLVSNPKDTIDFDEQLEEVIEERVQEIGSDGKMVVDQSGLLKSTLTEKLLVTILAKMSNFVPEGGIWLNTQRPEWNDANNALVGNGISMVTLYYIRRFLKFCYVLFEDSGHDTFIVNSHVADFLVRITNGLSRNKDLLKGKISDKDRNRIMDILGKAGESYREAAYAAFQDSELVNVSKAELLEFFQTSLDFVDHSIKSNKRDDGLYHAYNLLEIDDEESRIKYLYEMLEGQVSALSSGLLNSAKVLDVLDALRRSKIYRKDQFSYLLYPDRELPRFIEKNNIPATFITTSKLAQKLLDEGDTSILNRDSSENYHFNGTFTNASGLLEALNNLDERYDELVEQERQNYLDVFEQMFNHQAFTGRSGTFFGYEGLGSIYWHMVSKLLLAVQENLQWAYENGASQEEISRLIDHYYEIREGIGAHKSPENYGAFPTDPYSHTPANKGVQQPGMTGQVKEDVINRWAELGVIVSDGKLRFKPRFLKNELVGEPTEFEYFGLNGKWEIIRLDEGQLGFTYCQVPVVYTAGNEPAIEVELGNGEKKEIQGNELSNEISSSVFNRTGEVTQILVAVEDDN